jgi:transposase
MSGKRYPEEFKIQAVKQVVDKGYTMTDVAKRLGVTYKSLYDWVQKYSKSDGARRLMMRSKPKAKSRTSPCHRGA